jgi:hypothetical protein
MVYGFSSVFLRVLHGELFPLYSYSSVINYQTAEKMNL